MRPPGRQAGRSRTVVGGAASASRVSSPPLPPREARRVRQCRSRPESPGARDRKSTRLNSSHGYISYAVFCLKKKKNINTQTQHNFIPAHQTDLLFTAVAE